MFPTLFGPAATDETGDPARSEAILDGVARGRRPRRAGPQPGPRRARRGADRAAARPPGRRGGRPSRAAHPVRRRPRGDPPVRRDRRARRRGRGVRLQVGRARHQRRRPPPARRRAVARRGRGRDADGRAGRVRCAAVVRRPARAPDRAARGDRASSTLETLDGLAGPAVGDRRRPDRCSAPYRVRFDECRPDGLHPDLGPAPLHAGPRRLPLVARGFGRDWYAERGHHLAGPGGRGRGPRRRSGSAPSSSGRPRSSAGAGSGPAAGPSSATRPGRSSRRSGSTGSCSTRAARRPGSRPSSSPAFGAPPRPSGWRGWTSARCRPAAARRRRTRPAPGARPDGPRQQRGLRGLARRGGPRRRRRRTAVRAIPRLARLEYARAAAPGASVDVEVWPDGDALVVPRRATPTATCSARGWSRSSGRVGLTDAAPSASQPSTDGGRHEPDRSRPGRHARGVPRLAPRRPRRRRPGGRPARDAGRASGRSSPRRATSSASGPSRANGPCSSASATSSTSELVVGHPRALDHGRGRARHRRLRPGALGRPARAQRRRPGAPRRDVRGAPRARTSTCGRAGRSRIATGSAATASAARRATG